MLYKTQLKNVLKKLKMIKSKNDRMNPRKLSRNNMNQLEKAN